MEQKIRINQNNYQLSWNLDWSLNIFFDSAWYSQIVFNISMCMVFEILKPNNNTQGFITTAGPSAILIHYHSI